MGLIFKSLAMAPDGQALQALRFCAHLQSMFDLGSRNALVPRSLTYTPVHRATSHVSASPGTSFF